VTSQPHDVGATIADTLDALEGADNYRRWILQLSAPYLSAPVLELGAGSGTFTELLAERGAVIAVEPDGALAAGLAARVATHPAVTVVHGTLDAVPHSPAPGSAVLINVLEHIEDDAAALAQLAERVGPGGTLVLWVPAFQLLFSKFDRLLGHHRRYRKGQLVELVRRAGFEVVDARYANCLGWFSWLLTARLLGRVPTSPRLIAVFDRLLVPPVRAVERLVPPPFGQSVFLAARRAEQP
jgi:SAM-dependent methyltransferase